MWIKRVVNCKSSASVHLNVGSNLITLLKMVDVDI